MAEDYLNCGNSTLYTGAKNWGTNNGYYIYTDPSQSNTAPQWGSGF
jgi:hypothetical protein